MGIGEKLAQQRHLLGMSIEDIAATTGMSARQVVAIEANADQFAAPIEMSRMIRLYARKVGLVMDADLMGPGRGRMAAPAPVTPPPIPQFLLKQKASRAE
jgi:transcriptional regulator with XRE-family HTH domain